MVRCSLGNPRLRVVILAVVVAMPFSTVARAASESAEATGSSTLLTHRILHPDGTLGEGIAVELQDGKIKQLGPARHVPGQDLRQFGPKSVLCPGLIDVFSAVITGEDALETTALIDAEATVLDSLDPCHPDLREALRAGITSVMVAPAAGNLVCGVPVTFRTYVPAGKLDILRSDGPLVFAFGERVWRTDRVPTSRAGALFELRNLMERARKRSAHPLINAVAANELDALLVCHSANDLRAASRVLGVLKDQITLVHTLDLVDLSAELKDRTRPVVVGPYSFSSDKRVLLGAAALFDAGTEVAFSGACGTSSPDSLRITAALAVRHGLDPAAARRAITVAPAQVAGVADRVGSIVPGRDADLVVFSDDPLRLDAVVLEVYVKGIRVYAAKNSGSLSAGAGE